MIRFRLAAALAAALTLGLAAGPASACGRATVAEMNWPSAEVVTALVARVLEAGFGCAVARVPTDTVSALEAAREGRAPDIITEVWVNPEDGTLATLAEEGRFASVTDVLTPGGTEGWYVPAYLVRRHPELATLEGVRANPNLVGARLHSCPEGWACRDATRWRARSARLEEAGIAVIEHETGEDLAHSLVEAYLGKDPWFGYFWGPTVVLGRFEMTRVRLAPAGVEEFPIARVLTAIGSDFAAREPAAAAAIARMAIPTDTMSRLLAWRDARSAGPDAVATHFLRGYRDLWIGWVDDETRARIDADLG